MHDSLFKIGIDVLNPSSISGIYPTPYIFYLPIFRTQQKEFNLYEVYQKSSKSIITFLLHSYSSVKTYCMEESVGT